MKKKLITLSGLGLMLTPVLALAQNIGGSTSCYATQTGIQALICKIGEILNTLIPILVVAGVAVFIWGIVQFVIADDEEAKTKGRNRMIWGIIGLVVIVGMWGLVKIVKDTFIPGGTPPVVIPCVPGTPGC